eukprot:m.20135 g.20135  ORF g.20135 m.20135 type:complete len:88 (+) comp6092_c0_seq1:1231-1494(+)
MCPVYPGMLRLKTFSVAVGARSTEWCLCNGAELGREGLGMMAETQCSKVARKENTKSKFVTECTILSPSLSRARSLSVSWCVCVCFD